MKSFLLACLAVASIMPSKMDEVDHLKNGSGVVVVTVEAGKIPGGEASFPDDVKSVVEENLTKAGFKVKAKFQEADDAKASPCIIRVRVLPVKGGDTLAAGLTFECLDASTIERNHQRDLLPVWQDVAVVMSSDINDFHERVGNSIGKSIKSFVADFVKANP